MDVGQEPLTVGALVTHVAHPGSVYSFVGHVIGRAGRVRVKPLAGDRTERQVSLCDLKRVQPDQDAGCHAAK